MPFEPAALDALLPSVAADRRLTRSVTMAEARLSDGQSLRATSALYDISIGQRSEGRSSSGVILSTGVGSTAWMKSVVTGESPLRALSRERQSRRPTSRCLGMRSN